MPRVKYYNTQTGDWEYADSLFVVGDGNESGGDSGGNVEYVGVEPADDDIPKVYFTGTLPTSKDEEDVRLTMHYISKTADFIYPVTLKVQGSSSVNYPKKNFTLKPYKDSTYEKKQKLVFKNWPEMNKFVLKAHWVDHSHVRNVGTAKLWGKVVASRSDYDSLPEELRNAPNNGATDGFTVKVFCNGVYQGLYEWIVPKDKLFGQDSDIATHSILNSEWNNQPTCAFATTSPTMDGNWSEELHDSMSITTSISFAKLIKFVAGSTDEEFVANAENYFDVQSVIDYNIFARIFCIVDNLCRNQIFFTYDGVKWYEGLWDVDAILGLPPTQRGFFAYNTEFQTGYIAYKDWGVTNLLYQRVENLFLDRFKARYAELRSGALSIENILEVYERLTDVITTYDGLLAEDYASTTGDGKFTGIPYTSENNIQQIRAFVSQRIPYMDEVVENMTGESGGEVNPDELDVPETVPCTGITLDKTELSFDGVGTQPITATVTPSDTTDTVVWVSSNPAVASISVLGNVCTVQSVSNGDATITVTCGDYSASCSVAVSGIEVMNLLDGVTWEDGLLSYINGEPVGNGARHTNPIDVQNLVGTEFAVFADAESGDANRIIFFDTDMGVVGFVTSSGKPYNAIVPENAAYAKLCVVNSATYVHIVNDYLPSIFENAEVLIGQYCSPDHGRPVSNDALNSYIMPTNGADYILGVNISNVIYYDSDGSFIRSGQGTVPENASRMAINIGVNDIDKAGVFIDYTTSRIGWYDFTV